MNNLKRTIRCRAGVVLLAAVAASLPAWARMPQGFDARQGDALLARIEAKWAGVMTKIRGWDAEGLRQFREGYRGYPAGVLERALSADTFEEMQAALDGHAAVRAQGAMLKAFAKARALGATLPEDAAHDEVVEMRKLAAKTLGDDARDLVFIPVSPCTVWDTRFAAGAPQAGAIADNVTRQFYSHLDGSGGNFTAYGGNPACTEANQTFIGARPYAAMMIVYVNNPAGQGWLTFYRDGDPDPSQATISVYYSPGPTRTQTVVSKSSRGYGVGAYDIAVTGRFSTADASAAVVGYFVKAVNPTVVTSVGASAPLASSGGSTPSISLTGTIPVANGGTGATTLASNGIVYGNGTSAVGTVVGAAGQVLAGAAGAPAWTGSPSISGNLTLVNSTATTGNILKGANRFIHNYGSNNTFVGVNAGNFTMTGGSNTVSGGSALSSNTSGFANTASGYTALASNTTGNGNTASGAFALSANTTGGNNSAIGNSALGANTIGGNNTAIGNSALGANTIGGNNTATGRNALGSNQSGNANTATGFQSLLFNTTGINNVALGYFAGREITTGNHNLAVGYAAGLNLTTGSHNIAIGHQGVAAEANTMRIGTSGSQTRAFIAGIRGVGTGIADAVAVLIDSDGQVGTVSSSARVKDRVADMGDATAALMKLRPVIFQYTQYGPASRLQYGLIAEEVEQVYPGLVAKRPDGSAETVMYHFLPPMLLNEYQKQQRTLQAQAARIAELDSEVAELKRVAARTADALERLAREGAIRTASGSVR